MIPVHTRLVYMTYVYDARNMYAYTVIYIYTSWPSYGVITPLELIQCRLLMSAAAMDSLNFVSLYCTEGMGGLDGEGPDIPAVPCGPVQHMWQHVRAC